MRIEYLPVGALQPYSRNARTHSRKQIRQIARSIERFGFCNPVLIDDSHGIIAGHGRVEAAKLIGMKEVPAVRLSHMSDAERRAYILADNRLAGEAGWDREILALELQGLPEIEVQFTDLIDVLPEPEIRRSVEPIGLRDFRYHRIRADEPGALREILSDITLTDKPVLLATPGPAHARQIISALNCGRFVAVEKPIATCREDLDVLERQLRSRSADRLFIFNYYLIEKGLPLTLLARRGQGTPAQLSAVSEKRPSYWADLRDRLGGVRGIQGVLVEGSDHRTWLEAEESGGQTIETFSHLAALCCVWCDQVDVRETCLGRPAAVPMSAETLTWSRLVGDGRIPIELFSAKWAPTEACQRWFQVRFEHGWAWMDLEAELLTVFCDGEESKCRLLSRAKYEPQFRQLVEKLANPALPVEYLASRRAVDMALCVRDAGLRVGVSIYDENLAPFSVPSAGTCPST
jgi:hypothetical protein